MLGKNPSRIVRMALVCCLGLVAICTWIMGGRMLDPSTLTNNHLFQALRELKQVERQGILTVDVTDIFSKNMSGMTFPEVIKEMHQIGADWPLAVPSPGTQSGISVAYDVLRKIPGNKFKPHDIVAVFINIENNGTIRVEKAAWANTAAYP